MAYFRGNAAVQLPQALLELTTGAHGRDQWYYGDLVESSETTSPPLTHMTKYDIVLDLRLAQSSVNENIGMFMIRTKIMQGNRTLAYSTRPSFVRGSHWFIELVARLLWLPPAILLGSDGSLTQQSTILAINGFEEQRLRAVERIQFELSHPQLQVASASLSILAQLSGVRYLMYYWFASTAVIAIINIAAIQMFSCFVLYLICTWPSDADTVNIVPGDMTAEDEALDEGSGSMVTPPRVFECEFITPHEPETKVRLRHNATPASVIDDE